MRESLDGRDPTRFGLPTVWLIGVCWVFGCAGLLIGAYTATFRFDGPASVQQEQRSGVLLIWFASLAVALPLLALVVAAATRMRRAATIWVVLLVLAGLPAVLAGTVGLREIHTGRTVAPVVEITRCVPRSGSTHSCPGG